MRYEIYILIFLVLFVVLIPDDFLYSQSDFVEEIIQTVSIDSLSKTIIDLQNFGTRFEYSPKQDSAGVYIYNRLKNLGLETEFERYGIGQVNLFCIENVGESNIWIGGSGGLLASSADGGEKWGNLITGTNATIFGIDFFNRFVGWIVGSSGLIKKTSDRGYSWVTQNSGTATTLYDVCILNVNTVLIVGGNGRILRTTDGGSNWISIFSGTTQNLFDVCLLSQTKAIAVGSNGTVLTSTDAGISWNLKTMPLEMHAELKSVTFIDSLTGFVATSGRFILKTTDGGETWKKMDFSPLYGENFRGISFSDPINGWLAEQSGRIFKTTDGGENWFEQYSHRGWNIGFFNIRAFTQNRILVCGFNSYLFLSTDSGETWHEKTSNLPNEFVHISHNVNSKIRGSVYPEKEIILVAHYDSYSNDPMHLAPGADDNATGTAAVIEAARILKNYNLENTINFLLVSGEEMGMYGSDVHAFKAKAHRRNIFAVINTDMIGYPIGNIQPRLVVGSYKKHNHLIDSVLLYNQRYNLNIRVEPFIDQTGASDYGPFALAGYNSIHIAEGTAQEIWGGLNPYYHTIYDLYLNLNPNLIKKATQLIVATASELAKPINRLNVEETPVISNFYLYQNYPNPFNSSTNIVYQIKEESFVSIKIYDLLGREINLLQNQRKSPGLYTIRLNIKENENIFASSGVYFCRLEAYPVDEHQNVYFNTRKLLFLK